MVSNRNFTRIDTLELKEHIFRKVGHQRGEKYLYNLKRFLESRLSKSEFDRSCTHTIGGENISLHNKLIHSIIQNGRKAQCPPQKAQKPKGLNSKAQNGYLKFRDRPSPLGPFGKSPSVTCEETLTRNQEHHSLLEEGEEVEQVSERLNLRRWASITPPIGVSVSSLVGGARQNLPTVSGFRETCEYSTVLPDTTSLKARMEKKLESEGVGVSLECADLVNRGLDMFLKRLIKPCIGIGGSRGNSSNNMLPRYNGDLLPGRFAGRESREGGVSMTDFRVAMESNPRLLGEFRSVQLEKIYHYES